ncbi:microfibril-associated glycoprotein 4-like [Pseudophryne corroboree]|uniref:microfibril-associated glycoprotein 4-like n=1 Tax=Pseudophryne corroboree TaxID=495146 RepID=UPI003081CD9A
MWICCNLLILFLFLERGHQAADMVPGNQDNIIMCIDTCYPHDCSDVYAQGLTTDGVYMIYPEGRYSTAVPVYCDMTSKGGPWTVFQKRFNGSVSFYRGWKDYKYGFGRADGEYWLGLKSIHLLTQKRSYRLQINLEDFDNDARFVTYDTFSISPLAVSPEEDGYKLHIAGFQEGDKNRPIQDCLDSQNGMNFSTYDNDRDTTAANCAEIFKGASWYKNCHSSNLNGLYLRGTTTQYATGMTWAGFRGQFYSLMKSEMKIAVKKEEMVQ